MNDQTADREGLAEAIEGLCEVMHDAYEAAAVTAGWETQQRSRKQWADVPEANKATMRAAVTTLLASPQFARIIAEAEARALREVSNECRYMPADPAKASLWLRDRADRITERAALVAPDSGGEG